MSVQRAPASSAASAPGPSAALIASWRAAPFGYASLILDCQLAAAMERRPRARAIQMITPMRTRAPRATHSQMSGELDPLAATGEPLGWAAGAGAVVALWITDGWAVAVAGTLAAAVGGTLAAAGGTLAARLGEKLMLLLGARLAIAPLPLLPHPVTEHAAPRTAAVRNSPLTTKRCMPIPPRIRNPGQARTSPKDGAARTMGHHPLRGRPGEASGRPRGYRHSMPGSTLGTATPPRGRYRRRPEARARSPARQR